MCAGGDHGFDRSDIQSFLLARTALGDHVAFRQLHFQTAGMVAGLVRRIQPNDAQVQDIVQDVFLKVWNAAGEFDPAKGKPSTWIGRIARNTALDNLRRQRARPELSTSILLVGDESDPMDLFESSAHGPFEITSLRADARMLGFCLNRLPHAQRQSLVLAYFHDMSHIEIAQHMGEPLGTVKSWVRRSLTSLKTCISANRFLAHLDLRGCASAKKSISIRRARQWNPAAGPGDIP